jgi:hypothetical protein
LSEPTYSGERAHDNHSRPSGNYDQNTPKKRAIDNQNKKRAKDSQNQSTVYLEASSKIQIKRFLSNQEEMS